MQRLYSMFPSGIPGYGLLILRLAVALSLHLDASGHLVQNSRGLVFAGLLALSILIIAGLLTPIAAALGGVAEVALLITSGADFLLAAGLGPADCLLLMLLGPGAFSLDARLFGRVLIFHSSDPPPDR